MPKCQVVLILSLLHRDLWICVSVYCLLGVGGWLQKSQVKILSGQLQTTGIYEVLSLWLTLQRKPNCFQSLKTI